MNCLNCNNLLEGRYNKKFCSCKCSASYNNRLKPKRKRKERPKCRACENRVDYLHAVYCKKCVANGKHIHGQGPLANQTIESASRAGGANRFNNIRIHARYTLYRDILANPKCEKCGYDKHTELCHIKPISSFPKDTLVSVVNHRDNIMFLCPNCHWEHDHCL